MPWDMEKLTHRELQALEEKLRLEEADDASARRRL